MEKENSKPTSGKKFWKNKFFISGGVIILIIAGLVGYRLLSKANNKPQYTTATASRGTIVSSVSASGQVLSSNVINVATTASGVVASVAVKDGDTVAAGQTIMQLTLDAAGQQKYDQAYATYLQDQNTRTNVQYQSAAIVNQAQAALNNAGDTLQAVSPVIVAPAAGVVDNITFSPGMVVGGESGSGTAASSTSQKVAVIKTGGNPMASFNLAEVDVSKVQPGQKATITLDAISGTTFTGTVLNVDRIGTVTSNVTNYPVFIQFDTAAPQILPNMSANVSIIVQTKDKALLVPSTAVISSNGQTVAKVLRNGIEVNVPIETGLTNDTQTEVTSGLSEGDTVITGTVSTSSSRSTSVFGGLGGGFRAGGGALGR